MLRPFLWLIAATTAACASAPLARFEYTRPEMGTTFRIVLYARNPEAADAAAAAAFARVAELDAVLSDYDAESELSRLCARSDAVAPTAPVPLSDDLFAVLARAGELAELTGGAFDVTVGPYVRLWRRAARQGALPKPESLRAAAAAVGYAKLALDPERRTAQLLARGMRIDLGGIAKGYAADEALRVLARAGVDRALVDAGGDVSAGAPPPGLPAWSVAIDAMPEAARGLVEVARAAVATSGDSRRYVEVAGRRYSHVVDPRTGLGVTSRIAVTVVAADGMTADALASAVSVLGVEAGLALVERTPRAEARVVSFAAGRPVVHRSSGFRREIVYVRGPWRAWR